MLSMYSLVRGCRKNYLVLFLVLLLFLPACNGKKVAQNMESETNTTNPPVETTIYNIFQGDEEDRVKAGKILDQIDRIDWKVYESVSNGETFELLDFLEEYLPDSDTDKKVNFFKATNHLDGAYGERYASIVKDLFFQDQKGTISLISRIDPSKYEEMIDHLLYGFYDSPISDDELDQIQDQVEELKKSDITDSEKRVIDMFLNKMVEARGEDGYF